MIRQLLAVLDAELRMQLRQPMAVGLLTVLPLFVVPGGLLAGEVYLGRLDAAADERRQVEQRRAPERDTSATVAVEGDDPSVRGWLDTPGLVIVPANADPDVTVSIGDRALTVRYKPAHAAAGRRVGKVLDEGARSARKELLSAAGVSGDQILRLDVEDHGEVTRVDDRVGSVVPPLLHFTILIVALYTALDVVSGEKERKTGESLLCSAVDRRVVVAGKGIVVAGSAALAATFGLTAVVVLASFGWLDAPRVLGAAGAETLLGPGLLGLGLAIGLLSIQVSAACLSLAAWVPDYRTGSMLSAPLMVALLAPGAVTLTPVESSPAVMVLPIVNIVLACRDGFAGTLPVSLAILALAATVVHAGVAVALAARWLGRESALIGLGDAGGRRALGRHEREAFGLFAGVLLSLWFFGQLAQAADLLWGTVATQILLIGGPALAALAYLGLPFRQTLGWRMPRPVDLGLAVVAGLCSLGIGGLVVWAQEPLVPSGLVAEQLGSVLLDGRPLWVPLVVFAVLPGICEELLFRGALFGLLGRSVGPVTKVVLVAVGFGFAHLLLPRILPTAALGVLLGAAALRSRSLVVPMVVHVTNNAVAVTLGRAGVEDVHPAALTALAVVSIAAVTGMGRR